MDQQIVLAILKVLKSSLHQDKLLDMIPNQKFKLDDLKELQQSHSGMEFLVKENIMKI